MNKRSKSLHLVFEVCGCSASVSVEFAGVTQLSTPQMRVWLVKVAVALGQLGDGVTSLHAT